MDFSSFWVFKRQTIQVKTRSIKNYDPDKFISPNQLIILCKYGIIEKNKGCIVLDCVLLKRS